MYPYLMSMLYSDKLVSSGSTSFNAKNQLSLYINELDDFHVLELLYILSGNHGSSPTGTLDMITAYLHLPLATRLCSTENILNNYEIAEALGTLVNDNQILPKTATLKKCTAAARKAVFDGKNAYCE